MRKTILFNVTFIVIRIPSYSLKLNIFKMNWKFLIKANKEKYYSRISKRIMNPLTSTKIYWSILKSFLNNKNISCIPQLLRQNRYITKYKNKAELFNKFFAKQCSLINNSSVLPNLSHQFWFVWHCENNSKIRSKQGSQS